MPKFESTPNINNPELNSAEVQANVNVDKIVEGKLTPEAGLEREAERPELSLEEQLENLEDELEARKQEMTRLSEFIENTKAKINEMREKLGLPLDQEEPPSIFYEKDKLKKMEAEQAALEEQKEELEARKNKREDKQEFREGGEKLKENDLLVSDSGIEHAKKILQENEIQHKDRERTKRLVIDAETDTAVPGEFVLTIFDPEHPDRPASFDFVKEVFKLIKDSEIAVRYGNNPESS